MTAMLFISLFALACLVMALLCMPGALTIVKWIEGEAPGLLENLAFWGGLIGVVGVLSYLMLWPLL